MRFVALKSAAQQDIQAMHRIRAELVGQRTAKANQIRGLEGLATCPTSQVCGIRAMRIADSGGCGSGTPEEVDRGFRSEVDRFFGLAGMSDPLETESVNLFSMP
jgi:transposase